jgi:hypothetical protein
MQPMSKNYKRDGVHIGIIVAANQSDVLSLHIGWEPGSQRFLREEDVAWLVDCLSSALQEERQTEPKKINTHAIDALLDARIQRLRERKGTLHDGGMLAYPTPFGEALAALYKAEKDNIEEEGRFLEQLYKELEER